MSAQSFGRIFFASVLVAVALVGYGSWWMNNINTHGRSDIAAIGNQIGAVMVAVTKPATQVVWPVANHARKSDKSLASALSDDEAAGDVADAEDATFGKRFAALEQK